MPKPKIANAPKDWKKFRLADGTTRHLPDWANKPLKFAFDPHEALQRGAFSKPPKGWKRAVQSKRKSR